MNKILLAFIFTIISLFAKEYTLNLQGNEEKENISVNLEFNVDDDGKLLSKQKYDIRNLPKISSLKVITASGLVGTLKDEREIIVYYKTSLNVGGMKIRNLYKLASARVYGDENNISMNFDPDHYQNIISFLRYHNIKQETIKDINNMYGTWEEIDK